MLLLSGYVVVMGVLGKEQSANPTPALSSHAAGLLLVGGVNLLIFATVFALAWLASRADREQLRLRWRGGAWVVPLAVGYSVALRLLVGLAAILVTMVLISLRLTTPEAASRYGLANRPQVEAIVDVNALQHDPAYYWLTLTFVSFVVAGLREELWRSAFLAGMKALWPRPFGSRGGQMAAVAVAAVVFGFGHLRLGMLASLAAGLLGLGLGAIMVWHRSIWPAVIAHGMFDASSFALLPWAMEQMQRLR